MNTLAALCRDLRALTPADALIVALTPLGAFALAVIAVFPDRYFG
ncbi:hypothetical protein [Methylobacterium soli]|nr:hypothetical protein [Methylobacterium soli]GJE41865.1 hypothetical protein AEGHOMDF_1035 [Methylobacterium soli]